LAVGVIIHKAPVALSVGTAFHSANQGPKQMSTLITFILFILASPIGMAIGIGVGESKQDTPLLSILQALSGGSFIYLACCHLLIEEFHMDDA